MTTQHNKITWCKTHSVIREKFIVVNGYIKKKEQSQNNTLTLYLKKLEKEGQTKSKASKRK